MPYDTSRMSDGLPDKAQIQRTTAGDGFVSDMPTLADGLRRTPPRRANAAGAAVEARQVRPLDDAAVEMSVEDKARAAAIDDLLETSFLTGATLSDCSIFYLGPLRVVRLLASPRRAARTAARIAHDRYDGVSLQLTVRGHAAGEAKGRRIASDPGSIMVLDFAQPFSITDAQEREFVDVAFPRAVLARHIDGLELLHGTISDGPAAAILGANLLALAEHGGALDDAAAGLLRETLQKLTLLALGWRPGQAAERPVGRRSALFTRAEQLIDSQLGSGELTPEWLTARLNMSRSDLYSLFEDHDGVVRYIWRRRLDAARIALMDVHDTRRIGEIAFAFGFSSESHFARAFRKAFGRTASAMRAER